MLHHTAGENYGEHPAARIHQMHLERGWSGIGYHFLVDKQGNIHKGRPEYVVGAHCKGHKELNSTDCPGIKFPLEEIKSVVLKKSPTSNNIDNICNREKYGIVTASALNVRTGPGTNYEKIGLLKHDEKVKLYRLKNDWWHIYFGEHDAYVTAFIPMLLKAFNIDVLPGNYDELVQALLGILVLIGLMNNPNTINKGFGDNNPNTPYVK